NHLTSRGASEVELQEAGLVTDREGGGVYDRFRHRLVIPIYDQRGRIAGFGGRVLRSEDVPKNLNSPKTSLFDKSRFLDGLNMARREIRSKDQVVIVEGYLDVIGPYQAGFKNCVSPMGTALTEDQFRLVKRYSRNIILALDPDAAGQKATLRGLQTARQTLEREGDVVFDARGLMQVEGRLKADIRVTTLPDGLDPDEIALESPERWAELIEKAKPVVIHVMETLADRSDIDDPKTKEQIANQVIPLIEDVKGSVEREAYRQRLARLLKVDERSLVRRSTGYTPRYRRTYPPQMKVSRPSTMPSDNTHRGLEETCIKALIFDPTLVHFVDRKFRGYELACLYPDDFSHTDFKEIFKIIKQSLDQDHEVPIDYVHKRIPEELREALIEDQEDVSYPNWRHQPNAVSLESLVNSFMRLRRIRIDEGLDQLVFLQSQEDVDPDDWPVDVKKIALEYVQARAKLDQALQQSSDLMKK
ncbi:MAG: DNA primase, partial [Anaerolineales bacterium]